jgi:hypothetical protein
LLVHAGRRGDIGMVRGAGLSAKLSRPSAGYYANSLPRRRKASIYLSSPAYSQPPLSPLAHIASPAPGHQEEGGRLGQVRFRLQNSGCAALGCRRRGVQICWTALVSRRSISNGIQDAPTPHQHHQYCPAATTMTKCLAATSATPLNFLP